jgi:hypothetical protein
LADLLARFGRDFEHLPAGWQSDEKRRLFSAPHNRPTHTLQEVMSSSGDFKWFRDSRRRSIPGMNQIAPTRPGRTGKRIDELRTVQFWLEQNARMLATTIQALEVQRMTLSTLQSMNVPWPMSPKPSRSRHRRRQSPQQRPRPNPRRRLHHSPMPLPPVPAPVSSTPCNGGAH